MAYTFNTSGEVCFKEISLQTPQTLNVYVELRHHLLLHQPSVLILLQQQSFVSLTIYDPM